MANSVESSDDIEFSEWSGDAGPERWYVDLGGVRLGPLDRDGLLEMYESGNLRANDRIQPVGSSAWMSLKSLLKSSSLRTDSDASGGDRYLPQLRNDDFSDDSSEEAFEVGALPLDGLDDSAAAMSHDSAPQYFFIVNDREVGPVPFDTLQDLADASEIERSSRIRRESSGIWMTAKELGLHFSATPATARDAPHARAIPRPAAALTLPASVDVAGGSTSPGPRNSSAWSDLNAARQGAWGGLVWLVLAPWHYFVGMANGMGSVRRAYAFTWAIVALGLGWFGYSIYWNWSTTAATGVIQLDSQPLPSALITLTNMTTGETAVAFSGASGSFSVKTLSGELSHGRYRATIMRPSEYESSELPPIPKRYQVLATSDLDIEYDGNRLAISLTKN